MSQQWTAADWILDEVRRAPGCPLDDLVFGCPEFTWKQILVEIARLNRMGKLEAISTGNGVYTMRLPNTEQSNRTLKQSSRSGRALGQRSKGRSQRGKMAGRTYEGG